MAPKHTFPKEEKLCYRRSFDLLFAHRHTFKCGRLWVIYLFDLPPELVTAPQMVAFAAPKRNFKRAVDRNLIKRRLREAYRLHKHDCIENLIQQEHNAALLIKFLPRRICSFQSIEKDMVSVLERLQEKLNQHHERILKAKESSAKLNPDLSGFD